MHVSKIEIKNIKSLSSFQWELHDDDPKPGWHVFLGGNGSGKSTLLKSCALALLGPRNAIGLRLSFEDWLTRGENEGSIKLSIVQDYALDQWSGPGNTTTGTLKLGVKIDQSSGIDRVETKPSPNRHVWGDGGGWFSASFGPFRRFSGGGKEYEKLFYSMPRLASHLSIFGEDVALSETLVWLRELHYQQLDDEKKSIANSQARSYLERLKAFINQEGFLPNGAQLTEVGPRGVLFTDPSGAIVEITELSDGFRSILSMTLELLRQLNNSLGLDKIFDPTNSKVTASGVVIIDEIDVHLHPKWQRSIGPWLTFHFPNMQFLVTTHSPLVCQGATKGSITLLPQPGEPQSGGRIVGTALYKLLYGDILEALSSGAFGEGIERSEEAQNLFLELARLNIKARKNQLTEEEAKQRLELQHFFVTSSVDPEDGNA